MIYVDNGATSFYKPKTMIEAVSDYLTHSGNVGRGIGESSYQAGRDVLDARFQVAEFFDLDEIEQVIFTSGVTESLNMVIQGLFNENDHVITTHYEHNSVLRPLYHQNVELSFFHGFSCELDALLKDNTKAVIMTHASNVTGDIFELHEVGKWCHEHHILFIVDSAQSAGVLPISMKKDYIDVLCFSGHKGMLSMQGVGGLCIQGDLKIPPFKYGGTGILSFEKGQPETYPDCLETGTLNIPGIIGLKASIEFLNDYGIHHIHEHERHLAKTVYDQLKNDSRIHFYGHFDESFHRTGTLAFNIKGVDAAKVADDLYTQYGIETRAGAHCAPLTHQFYQTSSMVRISFGLNNTEEDAITCIKALQSLMEDYTK